MEKPVPEALKSLQQVCLQQLEQDPLKYFCAYNILKYLLDVVWETGQAEVSEYEFLEKEIMPRIKTVLGPVATAGDLESLIVTFCRHYLT